MQALLTAAIAVFAAGRADLAEKPVEDLLRKMRTAYSAIKTASMLVSVKNVTQNGDQTGRFSVKYASPNKLKYLSEVGANRFERYCDGKQVITVRNDKRSVTDTVNVDTMGREVPGNLEWLCLFDWKRQLSTTPGANMAQSSFKLIPSESWNGKKWVVLEETAAALNLKVRYFIDQKTYLIWRCDVFQIRQKRHVVHTEVTKLQLGVILSPATFKAPPP